MGTSESTEALLENIKAEREAMVLKKKTKTKKRAKFSTNTTRHPPPSLPRSRVGMHTQSNNNTQEVKPMGRSRYKITDPQQPHFVTLTVLHWIPIFTRSATVNIVLDSLRFLSTEGLKIYAWVILENHCHFVLQSKALDRDIARLKSWTGKNLIQYLVENNIHQILEQLAFYKKAHKADRAYQFWQEGVHPELIQSEGMMRQKIDYIHQNPVKRGYVDETTHWRYSSARDYSGAAGLLEVCTAW
ncbi:REP-associated tyrosine transposase [Teredinibacter turnerae]|uniref:REP-associated tyrosine transposase n=1 Tax=Teredinibacter turnerae TaxID=2426 RepID=UPI001E3AAB6C|nr:transposase [Teredinibacter turnerae]